MKENNMLKMAWITLVCDWCSRKRLWLVDLIFVFLVFFDFDGVNLLCFTIFIEWSLWRFMPTKEKMYYIMGLKENQIKKMLIYRTVIVEVCFYVIAVIACLFTKYRMGADAIYNCIGECIIIYALYEGFCAIQFASYVENLSFIVKARSIIIAILATFSIIVCGSLSSEWSSFSNYAKFVVGIILCITMVVFVSLKWFFIPRASFKEFSGANVLDMDLQLGSSNRKGNE